MSTLPVSKSKPVRILAGVAASALVVSNGLPLLTPDRFDWIGPALGLLGLAITAGVAAATEGQVTPTEDVAVKRAGDGQLVAGPASIITTGAAVEVTPSTPGNYVP